MTKLQKSLKFLSNFLMIATLALLLFSTVIYYYYVYAKIYFGMKYSYLLPAIITFILFLVADHFKNSDYKKLLNIIIKGTSLLLVGGALYFWLTTEYFGYLNYATLFIYAGLILNGGLYVVNNAEAIIAKVKKIDFKVIFVLLLLITAIVSFVLLIFEAENIVFTNWNIFSIVLLVCCGFSYIYFNKNKKKKVIVKIKE